MMEADELWHFNEAVSLLREARSFVPDEVSTARDIDAALPGLTSALSRAASKLEHPSRKGSPGGSGLRSVESSSDS